MSQATSSRAIRATLLQCVADPSERGDAAIEYFDDGLLWIEHGHVRAFGPYAVLADQLPKGIPVEDRRGCLLIPGLIDTHTHYPQLSIAASPGGTLFEWLSRSAFPAEAAMDDRVAAELLAERFIRELLRNGTTTAMVFASVQPGSTDAFFRSAERYGLCMISGKVLQDRLVPESLSEPLQQAREHTDELIERWHGRGRLSYALTPRFAPACSDELLAWCGERLQYQPDLYLQTHLAETRAECTRVQQLFPERGGYLDVYDHHGLLRPRSLFAHAIHLSVDEQQRLGRSGAGVAHCPASNLLLGSGLMPLQDLRAAGVPLSVGTDVGAGPSCSVIKTLADAMRVQQLRGEPLCPLTAFYLATLGGARALQLDQYVGSLQPGREADFLLLDASVQPELGVRLEAAATLEERLALLILLGDDRLVREVNILGERVRLEVAEP